MSLYGRSPFESLFADLFGLGSVLQPTTNAGRYMRQLDRGDANFARAQEEIDMELQAALRRVQIVSAREQA